MRKGNWDFAKAVLMIIVVFGHVCPALSGNTYTDSWCAVTRITGLFVMPLFFFISGYFQSSIDDFKGLLNKYKKSIYRIGIPLIVWGGVYVFIRFRSIWAASCSDSIIQHLLLFTQKSIVSSSFFFWFLSALLICVFLGSLLKLLCVSFPKVGIIALLTSLPMFSLLPIDIYYFSFVWFYYGSGMLYKLNETIIGKYKNTKVFYVVIVSLSLVCVVLGCCFYPKFTFYYTSNLIKETNFIFIILRYFLCLTSSICALFWIFRIYDRYENKKLIEYLTLSGQETLFIYCTHVLLLSVIIKTIVEQQLGEQGLFYNYHFTLYYILSPVIAFLLYYLLNELAIKLKGLGIVRVLLMGLPINK